MSDTEPLETVIAWSSESGAALRRWVEQCQARAVDTCRVDIAKAGDIAAPE
jgi:hypothetical protein